MDRAKKTRLKKLEVNSVDLVPAGANPDAHINLFKSKEERPAWGRFVEMVKKSLGMDEQEVVEVYKEHFTFGERQEKLDLRKIENEIWDYTSALRESFSSIINDKEIDHVEKSRFMHQSIDEFNTSMQDIIPLWSNGQVALKKSLDEETINLYKQLEIDALEERLAVLKAEDEEEVDEIEDEEIEEEVDEEETDGETGDLDIEEQEEQDMKINKSALNAEEQQLLDALIAKARIDNEVEETAVEKSVDAEKDSMMNEIAELKKALAMKEMESVAKGYEVLGKDTVELAKSLYAMKEAGAEVYNEFVSALDIAKSAKENSGMFAEIGKSRTEGASGVESKIEAAASEIQKANPSLSRVQAIAKAWEQHPELVREYDNNKGVM